MVHLFPLLFDIFEACVSAQLVLTIAPHSFFFSFWLTLDMKAKSLFAFQNISVFSYTNSV